MQDFYNEQKQILTQALMGKVKVGEENGNPIFGLVQKQDCDKAIRGVFDTLWDECIRQNASASAYKSLLYMGMTDEQKFSKENIYSALVGQKIKELKHECKN